MTNLTPEDKKRIYEEEKARLEAQERLKRIAAEKEKVAKEKHRAEEQKYGCIGCFVFIILSCIIGYSCDQWLVNTGEREREKTFKGIDYSKPSSSSSSPSETSKSKIYYKSADFALAVAGEYWMIDGYNVPVVREREATLKGRNLIMTIDGGVKVEVIKTAGLLWMWKYVYVYDESDQIITKGWISSETVTRAREIKGLY